MFIIFMVNLGDVKSFILNNANANRQVVRINVTITTTEVETDLVGM